MVFVVAELGFANTTVTAVCSHAKVSRGTFYEFFDGLDDCLLAVMDEGFRRVDALVSQALARERSWQDGIREALVSLLVLFDDEPRLARVCFVETLAAGSWALERRQRHLTELTAMIVQRWPAPHDVQPDGLAASLVMEALLGRIHAHLLSHRRKPLVGLLGPLMGFIAGLYLGPRAGRREAHYAQARSRAILAESRERQPCERSSEAQLPELLRHPRAHRARECVTYLARHPGASNHQIATAIGIARHDQISTLLGRLAQTGVIVRPERRAGHPNSWSLSPSGQAVANAIHSRLSHNTPAEGGVARPAPRCRADRKPTMG
jgi:AcrR family transcriptional regulator